jgi:hypothetical protein
MNSGIHSRTYVSCPKCGDPVPTGRISEPPEKLKLTCGNPDCRQTFPFGQNHVVLNAPVSYDSETRRWKAESPLLDQVEDWFQHEQEAKKVGA